MSNPLPQNSAEAAYLAFVTVEELVNLLARKKLINDADPGILLVSVARRLSQSNSFDAQRAAKFITDRMPGEE